MEQIPKDYIETAEDFFSFMSKEERSKMKKSIFINQRWLKLHDSPGPEFLKNENSEEKYSQRKDT